jgi:hypothetical protein
VWTFWVRASLHLCTCTDERSSNVDSISHVFTRIVPLVAGDGRWLTSRPQLACTHTQRAGLPLALPGLGGLPDAASLLPPPPPAGAGAPAPAAGADASGSPPRSAPEADDNADPPPDFADNADDTPTAEATSPAKADSKPAQEYMALPDFSNLDENGEPRKSPRRDDDAAAAEGNYQALPGPPAAATVPGTPTPAPELSGLAAAIQRTTSNGPAPPMSSAAASRRPLPTSGSTKELPVRGNVTLPPPVGAASPLPPALSTGSSVARRGPARVGGAPPVAARAAAPTPAVGGALPNALPPPGATGAPPAGTCVTCLIDARAHQRTQQLLCEVLRVCRVAVCRPQWAPAACLRHSAHRRATPTARLRRRPLHLLLLLLVPVLLHLWPAVLRRRRVRARRQQPRAMMC